MNKIKVAFFGVCHPHIAMLYDTFKKYDRCTLIGYADTPDFDGLTVEERTKEYLGERSQQMEKFTFNELLDKKPDLAVVMTTNSGKTAVCLEILSRGIPVIVEKPMALNYEDAKKLVECAEKHNTKIITNWPVSWFPAFRLAAKLAKEGKVGKVRRVVYRSPATWGPFSYSPNGENPPEEFLKKTWWYNKKAGGGSILDYACYGAMLTTYIFGHQAKEVKAITKQFDTTFSDVEDYSAMLLDFGDGVGLLEGSWSSYNPAEIPTGPIIYGSDGVIVCDRHSTKVKIYYKKSHKPIEPEEIFDTEIAYSSKLAENIFNYFDGIKELDETIDMPLNLQVMFALSAGTKSAEEG